MAACRPDGLKQGRRFAYNSPLQRLETLSARQQEEQKAIMEVSLQKTGKTLPFFLFYEEEKQGVTKQEAVSPAVYMRAVFVLY